MARDLGAIEKGGIRTQEVSILRGLINHQSIFNSRGAHIPGSFNMKTASGVLILTPLWAQSHLLVLG